MFVERKVCYSALLTNMVRWHAGAVSFLLSDIILAQLACPLSDIMLCLHSGITDLSHYKYWFNLIQSRKAKRPKRKKAKSQRGQKPKQPKAQKAKRPKGQRAKRPKDEKTKR